VKAQVRQTQTEVKDVEFELKHGFLEDGQGEYKIIDTESVNIALFPTKVPYDAKKNAHPVYNANIRFKESGIELVSVQVNQLKSGDLIFGQSSKQNGKRAISVWDKEKQKSYERAAIPNNLYRMCVGLIEAAHNEEDVA